LGLPFSTRERNNESVDFSPRRFVVNEFWFQARVRPVPRSVVVLDVSAAAAPFWAAQRNAVEQLAEALPPAALPDVAFLGSSERIPLARFRRAAEQLHAANAGRGRVVSPLLESFREAWPEAILLLAARPVIDLADWHHTPHAGRLTVARLDSGVPVADSARSEMERIDLDAMAKLMRPPPSVRIRLSGGIPFAWDNPSYRFDAGALVADPGEGGDVRVGFLSVTKDAAPIAELLSTSAPLSRLPLAPAEPLQALPWLRFTASECAVLEAWCNGQSAYCSRCGTDHAPGRVACPTGGALLPSLAKLLPGGFVRVGLDATSYQPVPSPALRVGEAALVVRAPAGASPAVWRYDAASSQWRATGEPWGLFERIEPSGEFVLTMPPVPRAGGA
jgi:hypothetical protein